jgi:hypothetical protein
MNFANEALDRIQQECNFFGSSFSALVDPVPDQALSPPVRKSQGPGIWVEDLQNEVFHEDMPKRHQSEGGCTRTKVPYGQSMIL